MRTVLLGTLLGEGLSYWEHWLVRDCSTGTLVGEGLFYWEHWLVRGCSTGNTGW